jgi:biotin carboxyl carrier protein
LQFETEIAGRVRTLLVTREGGGFAVAVDGRTRFVDAARIGPDLLSLVIHDAWPKGDSIEKGDRPASYEVAIWRDRASGRLNVHVGSSPIAVVLNGNRRRKSDGGSARSGPQRVLAPMPGKVVRLLVKPGEVVRPGQPLVVVEAMKMENELRATGGGTITQIYVVEGASVEAGVPLVVIE